MSDWDKAKEYLRFYAKDDSIIQRRDIRNQLQNAVAEGDKLQDKTRELDAYLSVEQLLAKRWEKFIELMGDDSYTELTPEEYVSQLDDREQKLEAIKSIVHRHYTTPVKELENMGGHYKLVKELNAILDPSIESDKEGYAE